MKGTINISGKDVEMYANAMTPVIFKRVFHKDFLMESQKKDVDLTLFQELGFVMAQQAAKPAKELMTGLTVDEYYEWLEEFGALDIINKVDEIFALYSDQAQSTSTSKKKHH